MTTRPVVMVVDVQDRYDGDLAAFDPVYLNTQIEDAQNIIDAEVPAAQRRLDAGTLAESLYKKVVCDMVLRVIRNTEGYRSEQAGDANVSRFTVVASGTLWITDEDRARLTGSGTSQLPGTINMRRSRSHCGPAGW